MKTTKNKNSLFPLLGTPKGPKKVVSESLKETALKNKKKYDEWSKIISGYQKLGELIEQAMTGKVVSGSTVKSVSNKKVAELLPEKIDALPETNPTATNMAKSGRAFKSGSDETKAVSAVNKIYNLLKNANEKKLRDREISHNFDKENKTEEERRHKEFLKALKNIGLSSGEKNTATQEEKEDDNSLLDFVGLLGGGTAAKAILQSLAGFLTSPLGIALMGITTFSALAIMLSGYLSDLVKQKMPDLTIPTVKQAAGILENGSEKDIRDLAEKATKVKPTSKEQAISMLEEFIKTEPSKAGFLLDEFDAAKKNLDDLEKQKTTLEEQGKGGTPEHTQIKEQILQAKIRLDEAEKQVSTAGGTKKLEEDRKGGVEVPDLETRRYIQEPTKVEGAAGKKIEGPEANTARGRRHNQKVEEMQKSGIIQNQESNATTTPSTKPTTLPTESTKPTASPVESTTPTGKADQLRPEDFKSEKDYAEAYAAQKNLENAEKLKQNMAMTSTSSLTGAEQNSTASSLQPETSGQMGKLASTITNENNQLRLQENINAATPMVMNNTTQTQANRSKKQTSPNVPMYVRVDELTMNQVIKKITRAV